MATPTRSPRRRTVGLREFFLVDGRYTVSPNNWLPPSPTVTPDESIIRQRGRKSLPTAPTRTSPRKSPRKSLQMDLTQTDLDESTSSSPVLEKDTETPGRTNSALRGIRKRLVLTSTNVPDDDPDYSLPLVSPPKKKKERNSSSTKTERNSSSTKTEDDSDPDCSFSLVSPTKKKRERKSSSLRSDKDELKDKLNALSQKQIIDVVLHVVDGNTDLQQEVLEALPTPDISLLITNLEKLRRNIFKALPWTRFGSDRDAFCFRRVKTHVTSFKATCVSQGKQLSEANSWDSAIDYVQQAWEEVNNLPDWDNESHCKTKQGCYRSLAALAKQAIRSSSLDKKKYTVFQEWLIEVSDLHAEIKPCIAMVEKKLKK